MAWSRCPSREVPALGPVFTLNYIYRRIISSAEYRRRKRKRLGPSHHPVLFLLNVLSRLYPSSIYTLMLFVLALSGLGDTPDYITGGWGMGECGPAPGGGPAEGGCYRRRRSFIKKTYLRPHLLNWRHLTGLSNGAIVLAAIHQMFPLGDVIGKVHLGDCLSRAARLDGRWCLRWESERESVFFFCRHGKRRLDMVMALWGGHL